MSEIKVGSPVWILRHRRRYEQQTITGETSRSWIVGESWAKEKILKANPRSVKDSRGFTYPVCWSSTEIEEEKWLDGNRYGIGAHVQGLRDVALLRKIAELIGYTEQA